MEDSHHAPLRAPERLLAEVQRLAWAQGLSEETLRDILAADEYVEHAAGERLITVDREVTHVHFLVRGAVSAVLYDPLGKEILRQTFSRGDDLGLIAISLPDRSAMEAQVLEPAVAIRLTLVQLLRLSAQHAEFQLALFRAAAGIAKRVVMVDRARPKPQIVALIHASDETRPLTGMLVQRLAELDERPSVAGDNTAWQPGGNVHFRLLADEGQVVDADQRGRILKELAALQGRLLIDVGIGLGAESLAHIHAFSTSSCGAFVLMKRALLRTCCKRWSRACRHGAKRSASFGFYRVMPARRHMFQSCRPWRPGTLS